MAPTIGSVAGDECLGGLFVGEKGWMVGWVMERKPGKHDYVRVREAGGYQLLSNYVTSQTLQLLFIKWYMNSNCKV